jgi:hypothetical protein
MALAGATSVGLVRLGNCAGRISSGVRARHSSRASHYASALKEPERGEAFVPDLLTVMKIIQAGIQIMQFQRARQLSELALRHAGPR